MRSAALALLGFVLACPASAAELTIDVTDIRSAKGDVRIAVFDDPDQFPTGKEHREFGVPARQSTVTATVPDLRPGRYAVAVFHDEDRDGEFKLGFLYIPQEGYGFSRDARAVLGPPVFDAAAFELPAEGARIRLRMQY